MFSKIKAALKDYFTVEAPPGDEYLYYPMEFGSYPFYKVSGTSEDMLKDEMDSDLPK